MGYSLCIEAIFGHFENIRLAKARNYDILQDLKHIQILIRSHKCSLQLQLQFMFINTAKVSTIIY